MMSRPPQAMLLSAASPLPWTGRAAGPPAFHQSDPNILLHWQVMRFLANLTFFTQSIWPSCFGCCTLGDTYLVCCRSIRSVDSDPNPADNLDRGPKKPNLPYKTARAP
jgi:hypothetical protein